jgi:hypothetical protein
MQEVAVQILAAFLIAGFSAWITVQLSLRRYRTEKWWERKADAYSSVIEALHNAKTALDQQFEADLEGRELREDRVRFLDDRARAATDEILKITDVGAFLLCDEALSRLVLYQKEARAASHTPDWGQFVDDTIAVTDRCIKDIIRIAKKDLRIRC